MANAKMSRQIRYFKINKRMLERDLKDLRDSGLIDLKYDQGSEDELEYLKENSRVKSPGWLEKPELPPIPDFKKQYYEMFPEENERTRRSIITFTIYDMNHLSVQSSDFTDHL